MKKYALLAFAILIYPGCFAFAGAAAGNPPFSVNAPTNGQVLAYNGSTGYFTNQTVAGGGTVTTISGVAANGFSWSIANPSTTPALTLIAGAITPTSVNGLTISTTTGILTISNSKQLTISNSLTLAGVDGTTLTFQATGTVVNRDSADTLTNKTYDTAGTGNVFKINGAQLSDLTGGSLAIGSGHLTLSGDSAAPGALFFYGTNGAGTKGWYAISSTNITSVTGTANQITAVTSTGAVTLSLPSALVIPGTIQGNTISTGTGTLALGSATVTFAGNFTTAGAYSTTLTETGNTSVTLPTSGTIVGSADTGTVTNTMLAGSIANNKLSNSSITIAGTSTALGGTITQDTITGLSSTGIVKRTGANTLAIATSATDYAPATSGTSILKASSGGFANVTATDVFSLLGSNGGDNQLLYTSSANVLAAVTNGTTGQLLTATTGSAPGFATFTGSSSIVTVGALTSGSIGSGFTAIPNSALANSSMTLAGHSVALGGTQTFSNSDVGLGNVTNDAQTKAAIVPNTAPTSGQLLIGNAGGTAYAPISLSGGATVASTGVVTLVTATNTVLGGVKPDGTSIVNSAGAISVTPTSIGIGNVTNDAQTKASILPNSAPPAGSIPVGNAGGTAYAAAAISGDATLASTGALTVTKTNGVSFTTNSTAAVGQLPGTTTNDNAAAGKVGEYISSLITSGAPVALTTGTTANLTSLSLTAGDWDVSLGVVFEPAGGTVSSYGLASVSTTSATLPGFDSGNQYIDDVGGITGSVQFSITVPPTRFSLSGTTTVYAPIQATFSVSTMQAVGILSARRIR